jgi:hypothetical protein
MIYREPKLGEEFCIVYDEGTGNYRFSLCNPNKFDKLLGFELCPPHRTMLEPVDGGPDVQFIEEGGPHLAALWVSGECFSLADFRDVVFRLKAVPTDTSAHDLCPPFPGVGKHLFSEPEGDQFCILFPNARLHPD